MRLSKRTEYGLRAVVQLARQQPGAYIQARDLAKQEDLPSKWLEAILLALRRGHFLQSKVGSGGGYRLSRAPKDICIGDLIRRLEGQLNTKESTPAQMSPGEAAAHLINEKLTEATDEVLDKMTLEELLEQIPDSATPSDSMYYI